MTHHDDDPLSPDDHVGHGCPLDPTGSLSGYGRSIMTALKRFSEGPNDDFLVLPGDDERQGVETMKRLLAMISEHPDITEKVHENPQLALVAAVILGFYVGRSFEENAIIALYQRGETIFNHDH